jgi:hypothetical protein
MPQVKIWTFIWPFPKKKFGIWRVLKRFDMVEFKYTANRGKIKRRGNEMYTFYLGHWKVSSAFFSSTMSLSGILHSSPLTDFIGFTLFSTIHVTYNPHIEVPTKCQFPERYPTRTAISPHKVEWPLSILRLMLQALFTASLHCTSL